MSFVLTAYKFSEKRKAAQAAKKRRETEKEAKQMRQMEEDQNSVYQEPPRTWKQFTCEVDRQKVIISLCLDTMETLVGGELVDTDITFDDVNYTATISFMIGSKQARLSVEWKDNTTTEKLFIL